MRCSNFKNLSFAFLFILLILVVPFVKAQEIPYSSLSDYCQKNGFKADDKGNYGSDCITSLLNSKNPDEFKLVNFNDLKPEAFNNADISKLILNNPDLISKYNTEILGGKFNLLKDKGILDQDLNKIQLSQDGKLTFKDGKGNVLNEYDLTKIPKGAVSVTILEDTISVKLAEGTDLKDLSGIATAQNELFRLEPGKFKLNGENVQTLTDVKVDAFGNLVLSKETKVGFPDKNLILTNNADEPLYISDGKLSGKDNSISLVSEGGVKKMITKFNGNGEYTVDHGNGRSEFIGGNGNTGSYVIRDASFGSEYLQLGDSGEKVKELQKLLGVEGTGIFDDKTKNALTAYQLDKWDNGNGPCLGTFKPDGSCFPGDGIAGPRTQKSFGDYSVIEHSSGKDFVFRGGNDEFYHGIEGNKQGSALVMKSPNQQVAFVDSSSPGSNSIASSKNGIQSSDVNIQERQGGYTIGKYELGKTARGSSYGRELTPSEAAYFGTEGHDLTASGKPATSGKTVAAYLPDSPLGSKVRVYDREGKLVMDGTVGDTGGALDPNSPQFNGNKGIYAGKNVPVFDFYDEPPFNLDNFHGDVAAYNRANQQFHEQQEALRLGYTVEVITPNDVGFASFNPLTSSTQTSVSEVSKSVPIKTTTREFTDWPSAFGFQIGKDPVSTTRITLPTSEIPKDLDNQEEVTKFLGNAQTITKEYLRPFNEPYYRNTLKESLADQFEKTPNAFKQDANDIQDFILEKTQDAGVKKNGDGRIIAGTKFEVDVQRRSFTLYDQNGKSLGSRSITQEYLNYLLEQQATRRSELKGLFKPAGILTSQEQ